MSYEELEEQGLILPEEAWGEMELSGSVPRPVIAAVAVVGVAACGLMTWGAGGFWTWTGALLFLLFLGTFFLVSRRGIDRQNARVEEILRDAPG